VRSHFSERFSVNPCRALIFVSAIALACWLAAFRVCGAAERAPVLVVPASKTTLHVAATAPEGVPAEKAAACRLVEVDRPEVAVAAQWVKAIAPDGAASKDQWRLVASVPGRPDARGPRRFRLEPVEMADAGKDAFRFQAVNDASLGLWDADQPVLVYNHGMVTVDRVPQKDPRRTRACYIHPLWGLQGEVLTDDAPRDHYHHRGIYWAWPHVKIDGREYDLWMYHNIQQKFVRWLDRQAGPVTAALGVENGWFVADRKVMIERVWLRAYKAAGGERSLDLEFTFIPVDRPITLRGSEGKSYGGLNIRYAPRDKTVITVPAGPSKQDLPDTPLPWADLSAQFKDPNAQTPSGAAVFIDPGHPDFPPTWLTRHYGILCIGWPGVKGKTFEPGQPIRLNYRLWIHRAAADTEALKQAYEGYAQALKAKWEEKKPDQP